MKTRPGTEKKEKINPHGWPLNASATSPSHNQTHSRSGASCWRAVWFHPGERVEAADLSHLDGRLLVDAEQRNVGHANEGPFLVGPEHDDGSSLRGLGRNVEVGKANAPQVGSQTNEDVPSTV